MTHSSVLTTSLAAAVLSLLLAGDVAARGHREGGRPPNILVIVADDLGVDRVAAYGEHPDPGRTPVIDSLAADGMLFRNVWANPVCGPSRATLMSGLAASTTGYGWGSSFYTFPVELDLDVVTLAELLAPTHRTAAIGKWHLASNLISGLDHPNLQGFEHFYGSVGSLGGPFTNGYTDWQKVEDGVLSQETTYATTVSVDDALQLIGDFGSDPWFVWLAFNAPHSPYHKPPAALHTYQLPDDVAGNIPIHSKAMVEAMDTELGRLFAGLGQSVLDETLILFVGDNGTDAPATTAPFDPTHAKATVFEGGLNVPLIVSGPGVLAGVESDALVSTTDLFATVADLVGVTQTTGSDSISFAPLLSEPNQPSPRGVAQAEIFFPNGAGAYQFRQRAARNLTHKLIYEYDDSTIPNSVLFFDLIADPFEITNLLDGNLTIQEANQLNRLQIALDEPYVPWLELGFGVPGSAGTPHLTGLGDLNALTPFSLSLTDAAPNAAAALFVGTQHLGAAFSGGVFVPSPDVLIWVGTDANGELAGSDTWPPGIPAGVPILFQYWIFDASAISGLASSNGLAATTP